MNGSQQDWYRVPFIIFIRTAAGSLDKIIQFHNTNSAIHDTVISETLISLNDSMICTEKVKRKS